MPSTNMVFYNLPSIVYHSASNYNATQEVSKSTLAVIMMIEGLQINPKFAPTILECLFLTIYYEKEH